MKPIDASRCAVHVCICTNEKPVPKSCCAKVGGQEFFRRMKDQVKAEGIAGTHWVTRTGCLGWCNDVGTTVVIHRPGRPSEWFSEVTEADYGRIWEKVIGKPEPGGEAELEHPF